ncbi:hypothetical protein E8E11_001364 [Didymella keratinophila]|nr:hypothetical protein E8E11_001364 [Didymella keratinophila]
MTSLIVIDGPGVTDAKPKIAPQTVQHIDAATINARSECLKLSRSMYNKLPKELRSFVYGYLCLEDRRIPIGPYYHFRKYEPYPGMETEYSGTQYCPRDGDLQTELADGKIRIDHDIYPEEDLILPRSHIFDPSYMSQDVVFELLDLYYESNSFSVCNVEGGLDELCTATPSSSAPTAFIPIDHVRDLQIRMKFEHSKPHDCTLKRNPGCFHSNYYFKDESQLRDAVDSLKAFRTRIGETSHEINIEFILMTNLDTSQEDQVARINAKAYFTNFLQSIRNTVYELLHDRGHVSIRVTHQDDGLMAFPKNYTGLFKMTKDQWEYEKSQQPSDSDWDNNCWILPIESARLTSQHQAELGGYNVDDLSGILHSRWGVDDIFRHTFSARDAIKGPYWPVGRPTKPSAIYTLSCKPVSSCLAYE